MRKRQTAFSEWIDEKLRGDEGLRSLVEENLAEMRIEQDLTALRERRGMTQRELATRMGVSQPAIAKLESGRIRNLELRTLSRWASALGGQLKVAVEVAPTRPPRRAARRRLVRARGA
jgi:transcriptional regulator with XRE-family HTH domain